jgi:hypothetical protein
LKKHKGWLTKLCHLGACLCLFLSSWSHAEEATAEVPVKDAAVESVGPAIYFRLTLDWPAQGVKESYPEFLRQSLKPLPWEHNTSMDPDWPVDALALVPQDAAFGTFRMLHNEEAWRRVSRLENPATFVGQLKKISVENFLLRCPGADGTFRYLPLKVDFSKAKTERGLQAQWWQAEAEFLARFPAPLDNGFFAYAREHVLSRLPKEKHTDPPWRRQTAGRPELYEITTGAMALQESLQLDRFRNPIPDKGARSIPIHDVPGVTVKSHPWDEMIGTKRPEIEPIASLVPENQYYVRFRSTKKLKTFLEFVNQWGGWMLSTADVGGRDYGSKEKIETQLCLRTSWLSDLLGESVIESLVITGFDPYLREGSDLSLIFNLKAAPLFKAAVGKYLDEARKAHPDIKDGAKSYLGVAIESTTTPDATVQSFRADLNPYYVYSNSEAAIRRIIESHKGKRPSLLTARDFIYLRTLYPLGAPQEDGFIFLSDAFLRALSGPELRIGEKRRLETITTLEMIKNAALFYLFEHPGAKTPTMETLVSSGTIDKRNLYTEPGDKISWDPGKFQAKSNRFGRMGFLTPNIEIPVEKISAQEKREYETFRNNYQDYWRRYFDPIGIRISAGDNVALSMTILPLLDNSEYNRTLSDIGGKPVVLEPLPRSNKTALHFSFHINPESNDVRQLQSVTIHMLPGRDQAAVEWLGERVEFWVEDSVGLQQAMEEENESKRISGILRVPMVLAVEVKNPIGLAVFLVAFKNMIEVAAPNMVLFEPVEKYRDFAFTRIRPTENTMESDRLWKDFSLVYGSVGNTLYVSNSLSSIRAVVDSVIENKNDSPPKIADTFGAAESGHMAIRLNLEAAKFTKALVQQFLQKQAQKAEQEHLRNLWILARTVGLGTRDAPAPRAVLGYAIESALGNSYHYDPKKDEVVASNSHTLWNPRHVLPKDSPLNLLLQSVKTLRATLEFTKEGLHTEISVQRKP